MNEEQALETARKKQREKVRALAEKVVETVRDDKHFEVSCALLVVLAALIEYCPDSLLEPVSNELFDLSVRFLRKANGE